jgi:hypothetical protein
MATYTLSNGYSVRTAPAANNRQEFTTTNPEGAVISTVYLGGADAAEVERDLIVANRLASL